MTVNEHAPLTSATILLIHEQLASASVVSINHKAIPRSTELIRLPLTAQWNLEFTPPTSLQAWNGVKSTMNHSMAR
jgi:hypothetical protein